MSSAGSDLIYLLYCAVNAITPDPARVQGMDTEQLYRLAKYHSVRAAVCIALDRAGIGDSRFDQAYKKSLRRNIFFDMERTAILGEFEQQGIWYMPLKGSLLKDLYPENGMREMSDNDILYDADKQQQVMKIMLAHGYSAEHVGGGHHDVYHKPPVLNFELHTALFGAGHDEVFNAYYSNTKRLMIRDEGSSYGYHFSDEDFYVFMTAHEWKHYNLGGTGIRSLLDCYVFCKVRGDALDWEYVTEQMKQLQIADFERERRELAVKVFSSDTLPDLTESEQKMLTYYLTAGTYGTYDNYIKKKLKDRSKAGSILSEMFPSVDYMKRSVKFVRKCPALYPVGIVYRWGRVLAIRRSYLKRFVKAVNKYAK